MVEKKEDYIEIHKFCIKCGKEKIIRAVLKRGQYKSINVVMKAKYLCEKCSPNGQEYYGNMETLLKITEIGGI